MTRPVSLLCDSDGNPIFAVLPYQDYLRLRDRAKEGDVPPIGQPGRYILLPNGGGEQLDVCKLIRYFDRFGLRSMMIINRNQTYIKFAPSELNGLDPVLRRVFLPEDSPYKNTTQAVGELVDSLCATGVFKRTMLSNPKFYRSVNGIAIVEPAALAFLAAHGDPQFEFAGNAFFPN